MILGIGTVVAIYINRYLLREEKELFEFIAYMINPQFTPKLKRSFSFPTIKKIRTIRISPISSSQSPPPRRLAVYWRQYCLKYYFGRCALDTGPRGADVSAPKSKVICPEPGSFQYWPSTLAIWVSFTMYK